MLTLKRKWLLVLFIDLAIILFGVMNPNTLLIILVLVVWSNVFLYAFEDLNERGALFAFLISFFLILIGREALEVFGLHEIELVFENELNFQAEFLVLISLLFLLFGFVFSALMHGKQTDNPKNSYSTKYYKYVRQVSLWLFFITFAFNVFSVADIVLFVVRNGYLSYYTSYTSNVPYIIKKIGDMCKVCFWIFLATMPEKRKVDIASVFYVGYLFLTLGTGQRFPFVAGMMTLFVYYNSRNIINPGNKKWIKKKTIYSIFILSPVLLIFLNVIGQIRFGLDFSDIFNFRFIVNFIYKQGVSINIIKRGQLYASQFPVNKHYLFGSTYEAISNNVIFRLFGAKQYAGNTATHALEGFSFQHAISYIVMGSYYEAGHGLGSCYIEEAFYDFGVLGVIVVNFLYGVILNRIFAFKGRNIWITAITISMLNSLLLAPRGSADGFITDILDLTTWGTILVVWVCSRFLLSHNDMAL